MTDIWVDLVCAKVIRVSDLVFKRVSGRNVFMFCRILVCAQVLGCVRVGGSSMMLYASPPVLIFVCVG